MADQNPHHGVITGTSSNGSLQEALDDATRQVMGPWRLASIDGVQGIVPEVNVRIFQVATAAGEDGVSPSSDGQDVPEVPTTRTGMVDRLPDGPEICQDGAEFELRSATPDGARGLRLRTTNDEARDVLDRLSGSRQDVTVTGYIRMVTCERMDVYHAAPAHAPQPVS